MRTTTTPTPEIIALQAELTMARTRIIMQQKAIDGYIKLIKDIEKRNLTRDSMLHVLAANVKGDLYVHVLEAPELLEEISALEKKNDELKIILLGRMVDPDYIVYNCPVRVEKVSENETRVYLSAPDEPEEKPE